MLFFNTNSLLNFQLIFISCNYVGLFMDSSCLFKWMFSTDSSVATAPPPLTLGEKPSYCIGCQCYTPTS